MKVGEAMTLKHLKIFVAVCKYNGVTAAAKELYLAQPSVSLAIRELEEHYKVKLFDRISRRMYLTEAGLKLLDYANHIVALFDEMEASINSCSFNSSIKIGSSITIGNYLLPDYVKQFKKKHPNADIHITIDNSVAIEEKLIKNEIDFGLIEGVLHNKGIEQYSFMTDNLIVICNAKHPLLKKSNVTVNMLKNYDFILREKGSGGRELFDSNLLLHGIEIAPIWESVSNQAIIKAVSSGIGLSVLPYLLVKKELELGIIKELKIKDLCLKHQFHIIYHKSKFLTAFAQEFIDLCMKSK